jgi:hypothetical protein
MAQQPPQPPDNGVEITTGTAGGSATNASVFNIADLKSTADPACTTVGTINAADYDDDPGGAHPAPGLFHVTPNLDDAPLQCANKYVFINNPSSVLQVQKTISAVLRFPTAPGQTPSDPGAFDVVFHDNRPASEIRTGTFPSGDTGTACGIGNPTVPGTVAHGLITTGQKTVQEITDIQNGCIQNTVGVLTNPFPVSKHLPPGWYRQCAVLATTGGGATADFCTFFHIEAITGFVEDVEVVDYGALQQNVKSIDGGDFNIATANVGTVMGIGNTSPVLTVEYSEMENEVNTTDESDNKYITGVFDVQLNRRNTAGSIIASQHIDNLEGGADPDSATPFAGATPAVLNQVCLEPNEPLKIDFSVTPREVLFPGQYHGLVRLTISNANGCTPTLAASEGSAGDDADPFNNLPGQPLSTQPQP